MNYKLTKKPYASYNRTRDLAPTVGLKRPADGYTPEEEQLEKLLTSETIQSLYAKLPTSTLKFIVAAHFELGYPQDMVAEMLGIKQPSLIDMISLIQRILKGKPYKPRKVKAKITHEDVFKVFVLLTS